MNDTSLLTFNLTNSISNYQKLDDAIIFATKCHSGQLRKIVNTPYILHPLEVATIISTMTPDEDLMIAGLLHDVIEDCNVDPKEIKNRFG
ncbi:MAG: bifunctional (p)ppGpp synthetase/guanosine-3',5'-bis(diphosphate) 3'-pyrophosphohydrolase, partial [Erysipelotrichaceae bacterium]|nr:bifunctional (p)ppGpp synthetase/guanosine-3',5'-bis(diphosphate) 3'-pyrophosphohydrolase [Erysipelotrichaceae bacterium]